MLSLYSCILITILLQFLIFHCIVFFLRVYFHIIFVFPNKDASLIGLMAVLYYRNYDTAVCTLAYFPGMSY